MSASGPSGPLVIDEEDDSWMMFLILLIIEYRLTYL